MKTTDRLQRRFGGHLCLPDERQDPGGVIGPPSPQPGERVRPPRLHRQRGDRDLFRCEDPGPVAHRGRHGRTGNRSRRPAVEDASSSKSRRDVRRVEFVMPQAKAYAIFAQSIDRTTGIRAGRGRAPVRHDLRHAH
ncbi:hypothetical protein ACRAWD_20610 [Caulobacter segnis]